MISSVVLLTFVFLALLTHIGSIMAVIGRSWLKSVNKAQADELAAGGVTIVRPVSQADDFISKTLESTFQLNCNKLEIIFCAARESDPAVKTVRDLIKAYPNHRATLLIGTANISQNPKLNNCVKGWQAASNDLVALVDSNVILPPDYLAQMLGVWDEGCGMVTSPPVGAEPASFWAEVECAFLNTHQARWQLIADQLGSGFAQGKNLLFRKSILEPLGGIACLAAEPAEDAAATKALRCAGYHIRLAKFPFEQPLGVRTMSEFWHRQVRWAKLRRATFPLHYLPEIGSGIAMPLIALTTALSLLGINLAAPLFLLAALWYGLEILLALTMHWQASTLSPFAMIMRDLLLPLVWLAGFGDKQFKWQGHQMTAIQQAPDGTFANGAKQLI